MLPLGIFQLSTSVKATALIIILGLIFQLSYEVQIKSANLRDDIERLQYLSVAYEEVSGHQTGVAFCRPNLPLKAPNLR